MLGVVSPNLSVRLRAECEKSAHRTTSLCRRPATAVFDSGATRPDQAGSGQADPWFEKYDLLLKAKHSVDGVPAVPRYAAVSARPALISCLKARS